MTLQNKSLVISTQPPQQQSLPGKVQIPEAISLSISTDLILVIVLVFWIIWDRITKPSIVKKLDGVFAPVEEERRLSSVLAQIGVITGASRVILAAFHNGALDNAGYHLQKLSTVNTYIAPGCQAMSQPIKDLPIGRIMYELEAMIKTNDWWCSEYREDLPDPCRDHLSRNHIYKMCNKLVRVGNLPIGILSLQYESREKCLQSTSKCGGNVVSPEHEILMDELYNEISATMRRRIIHPSFVVLLIKRIASLNINFFSK